MVASLCGKICTYPKAGSTEVSAIPNAHICDLGGGILDVPKEMMLAHDDIINSHQNCAIPLACA